MYALFVTLHLMACFIMLCAVMLQSGKGAEMGAAFGGASQTLFGARGPVTFLSKLTVGAAVVFMLTSLGLGIITRETSVATSPMAVQQPSPSPPQAGSPSPPQAEGEGQGKGSAPAVGLSQAPSPESSALPKVSPAPAPSHEDHPQAPTPPVAKPPISK